MDNEWGKRGAIANSLESALRPSGFGLEILFSNLKSSGHQTLLGSFSEVSAVGECGCWMGRAIVNSVPKPGWELTSI